MRRAARLNRLVSSPVRDLLALTERSSVVSFAGGLPAADSFPDVSGLTTPASALQYGPSEGDWPLRERVAEMVTARGLDCDASQVVILSGSQQGIDLVAKLAVEEGTRVAVESPTYLAALQVFSLFGACYLPFAVGSAPPPADVVYVNPTFHNPTGRCYSAIERAAVRDAAARHGSLLFEDDPYHDLCFESVDRQPLVSGYEGSWVYQGSFSKSLAPGLRLGFLVASTDSVPLLVQLKQAADLHSNRVSQHWILSLLDADDSQTRMCDLNALYKARRDHFQANLEEHFTDLASWDVPSGGLFFWLTLDVQGVDMNVLMERALGAGVAFMPGSHFHAREDSAKGENCLRLNFSNASPDQASWGLSTLAGIVRSMVQTVT